MILENKVSTVNQMYLCFGENGLERLSPGRTENDVVFAPYSQERWLTRTEILVDLWVQRYILAVCQDTVR